MNTARLIKPLPRITILAALGLFVVGLMLAFARPAQAHGYLIRVYPENRAVLERSPSRLQAWFSEGLEPRFSSFTLSNSRGEMFSLVDSAVNPTNPAQLLARIPQTLPDDVYVITMRVAFASDGHVFTERIIFWVGEPTGDFSASSESRRADSLEILWRMITLPALYVFFGGAILYRFVLLPGWGNPHYRAGSLPPRVMIRLSRIVWASLGVAAVGTVLAVIQQSSALFGVDPLTVIRDGLYNVIMNGTQIGDTLRARLIFIGLGAAILYGIGYSTQRAPFLVMPLWTSLAVTGAMTLGTLSLSSHAAGADLWLLPSVVTHWLHVLATGVWVGGLVTLTLILPAALSPLQGDPKETALMAVLRHFSGIGAVSVMLFAATGLYNSSIQVRQLDQVWSSDYGLTFALKMLLIGPPLLLALVHHLHTSQDRLSRALKGIGSRLPLPFARLRGTLAVEAGVGVLVVFAAAVLAATPPPVPAEALTPPSAPAQTLTVEGLRFDLLLDPGAVGANAYELSLTQQDQPVEGSQVWVRFILPALDRRTAPLPFDDAGGGSYLFAGAELDRVGEWHLLIDALLPGQKEPIRAAFRWQVPEISPTLYVRTPSLFNLLGGGVVVGAIGLLILPPLFRRIRALPLQPGAVVIGLAAAVVTLITLVAGGIIVSLSLDQTDRLRYPPPVVVNPVLGDADSLARGRRLFEAECRACHLEKEDRVLSHTLTSRRDERLYQIMRQGVGDHPTAPFDDPQAWDVVNYLRSHAFSETSK